MSQFQHFTISSSGVIDFIFIIIIIHKVRFKAASELAASTTSFLYAGVAMATLYVCACFGLLFGTLKYRHEGIAPWLALQIVYEIVLISCAYAGVHYNFKDILGEHMKCFCKLLINLLNPYMDVIKNLCYQQGFWSHLTFVLIF